MVDHILLLEDDETIGSVLQKVDALATPRVAIVAGGGGPLHNPVNVRLLQRRSRDRGMSVAVISDDEMTRWLCQQAGLRTYSTVEAFKDGMWAPKNRLAMLLGALPINRSVSIAAGLTVLGLLLAVLYLLLPAAQVVVLPAARTFAVDVPVVADVQQNDLDVNTGRIPAQVAVAEEEGDQVVSATGKRDAPDGLAKGLVTITNTSADPVTVPKGTIVSAGSTTFTTDRDAQVPAASKVDSTSFGGAVSVPVTAVTGGQDGNVRAGEITAIEGPLSGKLTVRNPAALSGGTNKKVGYLSDTDQSQAREALRARLVQQGLAKIHAQIERNVTFVQNPVAQPDDVIEQLTYEQTPEQVTSQTVLHMKVLVKGLTFVGDDVNSVVNQAMRSSIKKAPQPVQLLSDPLSINPPVIVSDDGSTIKLQVHAAGKVVSPIDTAATVDAIRGMRQDQALAYLRGSAAVANAAVDLWPGWQRHVPHFSWRIHLQILKPSQVAAS